jgi:hypothetical protein
MSASASELIATCALGAQNVYFRETGYIPKTEWNEYALNKELKSAELDLKNYDPREELRYVTETIVLDPNSYKPNEVYFSLPLFPVAKSDFITNVWLQIDLSSFNETIIDDLLTMSISFTQGGGRILREHMIPNLFYAHIFKKKIKENDQSLLIPISIFDLYPDQCVPLYNTQWHEDRIYINHGINPLPNQLRLIYDERRFADPRDTPPTAYEFYVVQSQFHGSKMVRNGEKIPLDFNHIVKFLVIHLERDYQITQVSLSLNKKDPIIWLAEELLQFDVYGHVVYAVPLVPNMTSFKETRKLFKKTEFDGLGINFSRLDSSDLEISTDLPDNEQYIANVYAVNSNIQRTMSGMTGIVYST